MRDLYHFIDTETSSLSPYAKRYKGEILQLGIITRYKGELIQREWKVQPQHIETAHPRSLEVNGYCAEDWAESQPFADIADEVAEILGEGVLVGHNIAFDLRFLRAAFAALSFDARLSGFHIDTRQLLIEHTDLTKTSLDYCRHFFELPVLGRAHTALTDAADCMALFDLLHQCSAADRRQWSHRWQQLSAMNGW